MNDDDGPDLEALEPLDPFGPSARADHGPRKDASAPIAPRGRRWLWVVVAGAAGTWIAAALCIALIPDRGRRPPGAGRARSAATTSPAPSFGSDPFGEAKGRFAVVVDGRLWIVDARSREVRGVKGVGRAQIVAVSGSSLLVRSEDPKNAGARYVVDGRSGAAVPATDGAWIPRLGGGWWIADAGGLTSGDDRIASPPGAVALAQVHGGFVVAPSNGGALMLWDPRSGSTRSVGRLRHTRLLGADANRIALADPRCPAVASPRCSIEIVDVGAGRTTPVPVPFSDQFVRDAVFSSDGRRLAIWGTRGIALVDPASGAVAVTMTAARLATMPLSFTPDAAALLVLEDPRPYRQVVVLRADNGRFIRTWVSEQQLEQIVAIASG